MKQNNKINLILLALFFIILSARYSYADLLSLQGKITNSDGTFLTNGNITIEIYDNKTGGNLIFNSTNEFDNNITNGFFDLLIGSISSLNLNLSSLYYLDLYINGENVDFNGEERKEFQSPVGTTVSSNFTVFNTVYIDELNVTRNLTIADSLEVYNYLTVNGSTL